MKRTTSKARNSKTEKSVPQQANENSPAGWAELQQQVAESSGISLLLVAGRQPPALAITGNNSICQALQSSPAHVDLCDPFCGEAHTRAAAAGGIIHYRCHAGLHCFAMPVEIDQTRQLAVIGGRAFVHGSDYRATAERFRSGDLQELMSDEIFRNVIFADEADLDHAALKISKAAGTFEKLGAGYSDGVTAGNETVRESWPQVTTSSPPSPQEDRREETLAPELLPELQPEASQPNDPVSLADSIRRFAEQIDASDPEQTYESIVERAADLLRAERGSLLLLDESHSHLTMTAAR